MLLRPVSYAWFRVPRMLYALPLANASGSHSVP